MRLNIHSADIVQELIKELKVLADMTETHIREKIQECQKLLDAVNTALSRIRTEKEECEAHLYILEMDLKNAQMVAADSEDGYVPIPVFLLEDVQIEREKRERLEGKEQLLQYKKRELEVKNGERIAKYRRWIEEYRTETDSACARLGELTGLLESLQNQQLLIGVQSGSEKKGSTGVLLGGTIGGTGTGLVKDRYSGNTSEWMQNNVFGEWKTCGGLLGEKQNSQKKQKKKDWKKKLKGTGMSGIPRTLSKTAQEWHRDADGSMTYNSPVETGLKLDACQGKKKEYQGTCGLCSCVNIIRMSGAYIREEAMVDFASQNGLCVSKKNVYENGGTSFMERQEILESYGINSFCCKQDVGSIERYVTAGRGVILSVDAGSLWYDKPSNEMHAVVVTSVRKDHTGNVKGFYICDSGTLGSDNSRFIEVQKLAGCLSGNQMNVTSHVIR